MIVISINNTKNSKYKYLIKTIIDNYKMNKFSLLQKQNKMFGAEKENYASCTFVTIQ